MKKVMEPLQTSEDLYGLLKVRYAAPSWALLPQVANGTGHRAYRWADGVAICCWLSLGQEIHGFEIKVYRGDFLREIRDGEKSMGLFQFCDRWWLVAAGEHVVRPAELPPTWGLMIPKGNGLHAVVPAPKLTPKPPTIAFLASVLRNAAEIVVPEARMDEAYQNGFREGLKAGEDNRTLAFTHVKGELEAMKKNLAAFEKASGLEFPYTSLYPDLQRHENFGAAVKMVLSGEYMKLRNRIERVRDMAKGIAEDAEKALEGKGADHV